MVAIDSARTTAADRTWLERKGKQAKKAKQVAIAMPLKDVSRILNMLAELRDNEVFTAEEFEAKKREFLLTL